MRTKFKRKKREDEIEKKLLTLYIVLKNHFKY